MPLSRLSLWSLRRTVDKTPLSPTRVHRHARRLAACTRHVRYTFLYIQPTLFSLCSDQVRTLACRILDWLTPGGYVLPRVVLPPVWLWTGSPRVAMFFRESCCHQSGNKHPPTHTHLPTCPHTHRHLHTVILLLSVAHSSITHPRPESHFSCISLTPLGAHARVPHSGLAHPGWLRVLPRVLLPPVWQQAPRLQPLPLPRPGAVRGHV